MSYEAKLIGGPGDGSVVTVVSPTPTLRVVVAVDKPLVWLYRRRPLDDHPARPFIYYYQGQA